MILYHLLSRNLSKTSTILFSQPGDQRPDTEQGWSSKASCMKANKPKKGSVLVCKAASRASFDGGGDCFLIG